MITLVLGGARSGKSEVAERLATRLAGPDGAVTYLATAQVGDDADLAERVARHRSRRPAAWPTVDAGSALGTQLAALTGVVLLDSLGPWLAGQSSLDLDPEEAVSALLQRSGDTVVVSDEVGLGVHPETWLGRAFRDALGRWNQAIAEVADEVLFVAAGRVLRLERLDDVVPPSGPTS